MVGAVRILGLVIVLLGGTTALLAQERYALVIGNEDYEAVTKLKNPVNDASDIAETLKGLGFHVDLLKNANLDAMEDAVVRLGNTLGQSAGSYGFFFYAGHGVQADGVNYLIPTGAEIKSAAFLRNRALSVQEVLDTLQQAGNGLNIVVLDACRDNPFGWSRSASRGLAVIGNQPPGSIVAYATSAGATAQDGTGRNGLYTSMLLANLKTPGLEIKEVFNRTGEAVIEASNNRQVPAVYTQFFRNAYLAGSPQAVATPSQGPPNPAAPSPVSVAPVGVAEVKGTSNNGKLAVGGPGPAGGIVVSVVNGKYLEAAPSDLGQMSWNDGVQACQSYNSGGFSDWRLPTKDELNKMYLTLASKNLGGFDSAYYWSSTLNRSNGAWSENFDNGSQNDVNKAVRNLVRPVREATE